MRIGLLLPSVYMGAKYKDKIFAPKQLFLNLADGLVSKGHEVYVYASPDTKTKARLIGGDLELIEHDFTSPKFRGLERITRRKYAHAMTRIEYEVDLTVKAYLHAKEKKLQIMHLYHDFMAHYVNTIVPIKTVYSIHDPRPKPHYIDHWRLRNFRNDNYIFISQSQHKNFSGLARSVGVVYHGIELNKFPFQESGGSYLAFLGRYIREKGVLEAIAAAKAIGLPLKMIGDDVYRALPYYQEKVLPHLKKGVVEDETFLREGDRAKFLQNAKALLFPILWDEPFGMVMIEAMAVGTPVIAFDRGSVSEVVKDGVTGFVVSPKEGVRGLVSAIKKLQSLSVEEYQKMRAACRAHVEKNFTVEKMVEGYEEVYKKVIK